MYAIEGYIHQKTLLKDMPSCSHVGPFPHRSPSQKSDAGSCPLNKVFGAATRTQEVTIAVLILSYHYRYPCSSVSSPRASPSLLERPECVCELLTSSRSSLSLSLSVSFFFCCFLSLSLSLSFAARGLVPLGPLPLSFGRGAYEALEGIRANEAPYIPL